MTYPTWDDLPDDDDCRAPDCDCRHCKLDRAARAEDAASRPRKTPTDALTAQYAGWDENYAVNGGPPDDM